MRPCCDPAGGGWAGRTAQRSQHRGEPGSEKNLSREECVQRRGNCFRWKVAAMKPKAQPFPRQDSRQAKDARAARSRMETWPTRHPRVTASPACALTRARPTPQRRARTLPAADCGDGLEAWRGCSIARPGGVSVNRPSRRTGANRQRRGRHALAQPAAASRGVAPQAPPIAAGRHRNLARASGRRSLYRVQGTCTSAPSPPGRRR